MSLISILIGIVALFFFIAGIVITISTKTDFDSNMVMIAAAIFLVAAAICFR